MSPEALGTAIRDRPDLRGQLDGWCFYTEVPRDVPVAPTKQMRRADTSAAAVWRGLLDASMRFMAWNALAQADRRPGQLAPTKVSLSLLTAEGVQAELELLDNAARGDAASIQAHSTSRPEGF